MTGRWIDEFDGKLQSAVFSGTTTDPASLNTLALFNGSGSGGLWGNTANRIAARDAVQFYTGWVYVAVKTIADSFAGEFPRIGRKTNQRSGKGLSQRSREWVQQSYGQSWLTSDTDDIEPVSDEHPLPRLLMNPNPMDSWEEFAMRVAMFGKLTGLYYIMVVPNGAGVPVQMWAVPTDWVTPFWGPDGTLLHYSVQPTRSSSSSRGVNWPPEWMIVGRNPSPLSYHDGWSELDAAFQWAASSSAIEEVRMGVFRNGTFPDVTVEFADNYQNAGNYDALADRIKERWLSRMSGVARAGEPLVAPPGVKIQRFSTTPKEMEFPQSADQLRDHILALYKVPPILAGMSRDINRATSDTAYAIFCQQNLNPMLRRFATVLTLCLANRFEAGLRIWYDDCTPADRVQRLNELSKGVDVGAVTPNEFRDYLGLPPIEEEEYDVGYQAMGRVPMVMEEPPEDVDPNADLSGGPVEEDAPEEAMGEEEEDATNE